MRPLNLMQRFTRFLSRDEFVERSAFAAATWIASTAVKGTDLASVKAALTNASSASRQCITLSKKVQEFQFGLGVCGKLVEAVIRA